MIDSSFMELTQLINAVFQQKIANRNSRHKSELLLTVTQKQVNDALQRFVTNNVNAILKLSVDLHDEWFRLYCTVNVAGIFIDIFADFKVVQIELNKHRQRLVFEQLSQTHVNTLQANSYPKKIAINSALAYYHKLLKQDPLGMIFDKFDWATAKDNVIYIDIGRWLSKDKKIISTLTKAQVNTATTDEQQLLLNLQINYRNLLASDSPNKKDIITEADKPVTSDDAVDASDLDDATNSSTSNINNSNNDNSESHSPDLNESVDHRKSA